MKNNIPRVRADLEFIPIEHEGQQIVLVRDPLGLTQEGGAIGLPLFHMLSQLEVTRTREAFQQLLTHMQGGVEVPDEDVDKVLTQLDEAFFLDSERYSQARKQIVTEFMQQPTRPAVFAGASYPGDPEELAPLMEAMLTPQTEDAPPPESPLAIVAPHIDPAIGELGYGAAYRSLQHAAPKRVLIFGVGHGLMDGMYSLTEKDFETPLGVVTTDKTAIKMLRDAGQNIIAPDDFVHKSEHSIEFQALFLRQALPKDSFSIIPILCGSFLFHLPEYSRQAFLDLAGPFLETLKDMMRSEQRALAVAGVDFCHIGPKFGHKRTGKEIEPEAREHDEQLMQCLLKGDAEGFWRVSAAVEDKYNVCGFSALATLLEILPESRGVNLGYDMWHEDPTQSAVSFAAAVFS